MRKIGKTALRAQVAAQLVDARRTQILEAATQVFAKKGFHHATIREIASVAGIADGTIYIYFKSKPDLLLGILKQLNESERRAVDLAPALSAGGAMDVRSYFAEYVRHRLTVVDDNMRAFQAVLPDLLSNAVLRKRYLREVIEPTFRLAEPMFQQWMEAGVIRHVNVALTMRAVPALILGMMVLRMMGDTAVEQSWAELPALVTSMIFDGLGKETAK